MLPPAIRKPLAEALYQDVDGVYDEFSWDGGAGPKAFVEHLLAFELIEPDLGAELLADLTESASRETVQQAAPQALEMVPNQSQPGDAKTLRLPANSLNESAGLFDDDDATVKLPANYAQLEHEAETVMASDRLQTIDPEPAAAARTMFRRVSGGKLRQTGAFGDQKAPVRKPKPKGRGNLRPPDTTHYSFKGVVGEGAMGKIHLATDRLLHRDVAYKVMSDEIAGDPLEERFGAEAQVTAQLDHPNIVPVYALESKTAYAMKFIEGHTLEHYIETLKELSKARKPLPSEMELDRRLDLFLRVCDAVSYAHSRGVIHRDLKPENIMIGAFNEVYVMDWGIAKVLQDVEHPVIAPAAEDEEELIIGTPGYMSPEQADGHNDSLTGHSDQYSLGLILFELLTLKPALSGKTVVKIVMRQQDGETDSLKHIAGEHIPPELGAIVAKATAKEAKRRYGDVADLADDVRRYLRGDPVRARPDSIFQAILRWMGRHREFTLMAVMLIFVGFGGITFATILLTQWQLSVQADYDERLRAALNQSSEQTAILEGRLLKYEGLLSVIASTATDAITREGYGEVTTIYTGKSFDTPSMAPKGAAQSKGGKYGEYLVSTDHPVVVADPETIGANRNTLYRLGSLAGHLQGTLLRSISDEQGVATGALARRRILSVDTPVKWAFIGLEDGILLNYPGHGGWPERYDPRKAGWYSGAVKSHTPTLGVLELHPVVGTPVLTISQGLFDSNDKFLGVAGLEVTLDHIVELMTPDGTAREGVQTYLLDKNGMIVVDSAMAEREFETKNRTLRAKKFSDNEVTVSIANKKSGNHFNDAGQLISFTRMASNGWYYVVVTDEAAL